MLVQTSTLTSPALDWAVATIEKLPIKKDPMGFGRQSPGGYWVWADGFPPSIPYMQIGKKYSPSTHWEQGGPIIERERIELHPDEGTTWMAIGGGSKSPCTFGPTPLVAVMRCLVASELGSEIEVPDELLVRK